MSKNHDAALERRLNSLLRQHQGSSITEREFVWQVLDLLTVEKMAQVLARLTPDLRRYLSDWVADIPSDEIQPLINSYPRDIMSELKKRLEST